MVNRMSLHFMQNMLIVEKNNRFMKKYLFYIILHSSKMFAAYQHCSTQLHEYNIPRAFFSEDMDWYCDK